MTVDFKFNINQEVKLKDTKKNLQGKVVSAMIDKNQMNVYYINYTTGQSGWRNEEDLEEV